MDDFIGGMTLHLNLGNWKMAVLVSEDRQQ